MIVLNEIEEKNIAKWIRKHRKTCTTTLPYEFTEENTGIGPKITIICPLCKDFKDITDYDLW